MQFKNIKSPSGDRINITCKDDTCDSCDYIQIFEYPWKVPIKVLDGEKDILDFKYCEVFSRFAKVHTLHMLLPEPLDIDDKNNCLRHEKCLRSEIPFPDEKKVKNDN